MRILYIDIDALRPDHLGCYGYHRATSPNIDALAHSGLRFNQCYTSDAPCLPSRTALCTGMFGIHSGVVGHGGTAADLRIEGYHRGMRDRIETGSLASRLQQAGYYTAQITPFGQRHAARQFYAGFREMHNTGKGGIESAEDVTPAVERWLKGHASDDNWFLHVNYWDPHTPFRVPPSYAMPFAEDPLPDWLTPDVLESHQQKVGPHGARELYMFHDRQPNAFYPRELRTIRTMDDLRDWMNGYDTAIRYVDDQIGRIMQLLTESGVGDDTVVIISSDHGECQGELGIYGEHATADYITCRVPLIIRWPGKAQGTVDEHLRYSLDLAPTLADLLGLERSDFWDGASFAPALEGETEIGRSHIVVSQCAHVCQRSVRFGDWIYLRTYHDGYHLFPREMLFNVRTDPHEQYDVARENRDLCDQALRYLSEWHDEQMLSMDSPTDPLWTVMREGGPYHARGALAEYCDRLKRTDRGWAVAELRKRHPREFEG